MKILLLFLLLRIFNTNTICVEVIYPMDISLYGRTFEIYPDSSFYGFQSRMYYQDSLDILTIEPCNKCILVEVNLIDCYD